MLQDAFADAALELFNTELSGFKEFLDQSLIVLG